ncbi:MAG: TlpA family protein disulfide reductase [Desulfomonilia bacterium]|jgi:hypothetical protein
MPGAELVRRIRIDTIESVLREEKPVLVACIRDDVDYHETLEGIETVAVFIGPELSMYFVLEDLLSYFETRYGITGTPTFLLIRHGDLMDSLLGKASVQDLMDFIRPHIQSLAESKGPKRHDSDLLTHTDNEQGLDHPAISMTATRKRGIV